MRYVDVAVIAVPSAQNDTIEYFNTLYDDRTDYWVYIGIISTSETTSYMVNI